MAVPSVDNPFSRPPPKEGVMEEVTSCVVHTYLVHNMLCEYKGSHGFKFLKGFTLLLED